MWAEQTPIHSQIFLSLNTQEGLTEIFVIHSANTMKRLFKYIWQTVSSHNKKSVSQPSTYRFYFTQKGMRLRGGSMKINKVNEARNHLHQKLWIIPESRLVLVSLFLFSLRFLSINPGALEKIFTQKIAENIHPVFQTKVPLILSACDYHFT